MPSVEDVTEWAIADASHGYGENRARVAKAKPQVKQTPTAMDALAEWERRGDKTLAYVSGVLAYGFPSYMKPSQHSALVRLIKGGHLRLCKVDAPPPPRSNAHHGSPYSSRYYILRPGSCPAEVPEGALAGLRTPQRRR